MQNDAYEACNQWFELMEKIQPEISDMFKITIISPITCNECNTARDANFVNEYSLSVSICDRNIFSIQNAINFFENE